MKRIVLYLIIACGILWSQTVLKQVTFRFQPVISGVENIFLAGTFNDWSDSRAPMSDEDGDGVYEVTILMRPGTYQYKFVVDGAWITDPEAEAYADEGRGESNALITVTEDQASPVFKRGDAHIFTDRLAQTFDYFLVNPMETGLEFRTRAYVKDVMLIELLYGSSEETITHCVFNPTENDGIFQYYRVFIEMDPENNLDFVLCFQDGEIKLYSTPQGFIPDLPALTDWFHYHAKTLPRFTVPDWVQQGIFYQIFPERFCNRDQTNDPDFSESYYQGKTKLPPEGKLNGEYFHLVQDWDDISGLSLSPYRTDGRPDLYSFYGGDIQGVMDKLNYLKDLGITIIYFNPLNQGKSNHKYDPVDYLSIDPHFADESTFKAFVKKAHKKGIRVIVDMAFNHTGDSHFAFLDTQEKGPDSKYWLWYEWHDWPLPEGGCPTPCFYYDCWWDFPLHPNLNFDLSRPNPKENDIRNISEAEPNQEVVDYILEVARYWLGDLDIDGFRLDVPNEVPFWFWAEFRRVVEEVKPDAFLIGEIWGNAMPWLGPTCFHSTMNYKYFRDPVLKFIGKGQGSAKEFDQTLTTGRNLYPLQASLSMMNLMGSHDTERIIHQADGNVRRVMLAALFSMTYPGVPHIYYGDEVGLEGGKDPDNRRTFPWNWKSSHKRRGVHDFYRKLVRLRHRYSALRTGQFKSVFSTGKTFAYIREDQDHRFLIILHNENQINTVCIPLGKCGFRKNNRFKDLLNGKRYVMTSDTLKLEFQGLDGKLLIVD
ncbi:alpha-amylase family glycosyl hydrolase [bacterium]